MGSPVRKACPRKLWFPKDNIKITFFSNAGLLRVTPLTWNKETVYLAIHLAEFRSVSREKMISNENQNVTFAAQILFRSGPRSLLPSCCCCISPSFLWVSFCVMVREKRRRKGQLSGRVVQLGLDQRWCRNEVKCCNMFFKVWFCPYLMTEIVEWTQQAIHSTVECCRIL